MTGSRRSRGSAIVVFVLIAVVLLGGMTWASWATFELAKKNVSDRHASKIGKALWRLDGYIGGVKNSEAARPYTDYRLRHAEQGVVVRSADHMEQEADLILLYSPLAKSEPPQKWIDLYFQVNQDGVASSPQVPEEGAVSFADNPRLLAGCDPRVCDTWRWLSSVLPSLDLGQRLAEAEDGENDGVSASLVTMRDGADTQRVLHPENQQRKQNFRDAQQGYLRPAECVAPHIAQRNIRTVGESDDDADRAHPTAAEVRVETGKFAPPFWMEPQPQSGPKLAFVRPCAEDESTFYQGFIVDWRRLKRELLDQIDDLLPQADLKPILDGESGAEPRMVTLPVQLEVPDLPGGAAAAAWQQVGNPLVATWLTAVAVLGVAGWGLRSLVQLANRRMQFAYAVTHELRTPLTTFRLYTDMLAAGLIPNESVPEYLNTLSRESQRLASLVEDVLEYARLENHRVRLAPTETDGPALLDRLRENLSKRCSDAGVQAVTENALAGGQRLCTDVDVVNRIATVLVNNACRHARGVSDPRVVLRLESENGSIHLDVIDSGPGIDRADARVIFKPFRRGRKADSKAQSGIGLGLSLARSWADLLGGRLELVARHHPTLGGAHFRLTIPREAPARDA